MSLLAKPVLDVMLIFEDLEALEQAIIPLEELGFIYEGDIVSSVVGVNPDPNRQAFSYYNVHKHVNYIYLHAYIQGHPDAVRNLMFRGKLFQNSDLAREYSLDFRLSQSPYILR